MLTETLASAPRRRVACRPMAGISTNPARSAPAIAPAVLAPLVHDNRVGVSPSPPTTAGELPAETRRQR